MEVRVARPTTGEPDLVFDGRLLVERSSQEDGKRRWTDIRVWATSSGRWVVEIVGRSRVRGEKDRVQATLCITPAGVFRALHRANGRYLTALALDVLRELGRVDERLAGLAEERV